MTLHLSVQLVQRKREPLLTAIWPKRERERSRVRAAQHPSPRDRAATDNHAPPSFPHATSYSQFLVVLPLLVPPRRPGHRTFVVAAARRARRRGRARAVVERLGRRCGCSAAAATSSCAPTSCSSCDSSCASSTRPRSRSRGSRRRRRVSTGGRGAALLWQPLEAALFALRVVTRCARVRCCAGRRAGGGELDRDPLARARARAAPREARVRDAPRDAE